MAEGAGLGPTGSHITDPGKQARSASGIPIVPVFDGYRAFAILGVVMLHLTTASGLVGITDGGLLTRLSWGVFGHAVEVLFVISGFVVFLPTVSRGGRFGSLVSYAIRRGARLLPAYWLILVISLLLVWILGSPVTDTKPGFESIFFHFTGLQVPASFPFGGWGIGFGVNQPLWTLSVEIGFYVVLPLIAGVFFRRPLAGLLIALAITVIWDLAFDHLADVLSLLDVKVSFNEFVRLVLVSKLQLPTWAFSFALGMFGAWSFVRLTSWRQATDRPERFDGWVKTVLLVAGLALAALVYLSGGGFDDTRENLVVAVLMSISLAVVMVALAFSPPALQRPFANQWIRQLGDISYGVYLVHMLLLLYLDDWLSLPRGGGFGDFAIWVIAVLPASILYGYLSARFLEQPVRRWARQFGRSASTRSDT